MPTFLDLPKEIREEVYLYVIEQTQTHREHPLGSPDQWDIIRALPRLPYLDLRLLNHQINQDIEDLTRHLNASKRIVYTLDFLVGNFPDQLSVQWTQFQAISPRIDVLCFRVQIQHMASILSWGPGQHRRLAFLLLSFLRELVKALALRFRHHHPAINQVSIGTVLIQLDVHRVESEPHLNANWTPHLDEAYQRACLWIGQDQMAWFKKELRTYRNVDLFSFVREAPAIGIDKLLLNLHEKFQMEARGLVIARNVFKWLRPASDAALSDLLNNA